MALSNAYHQDHSITYFPQAQRVATNYQLPTTNHQLPTTNYRRMDQLKPQLPDDHLEYVEAWGRASGSMAHVFRPSTVADLKQTLELAKETGRTVGYRGGGNSYGDAFGNRENIVLDTTRLNRVISWDPESGLIKLEPGVTIEQLWRYVLADGWWPPIVTGTAKTTVGGCASMNTHGKNGWQMGTFGDHITEIEMLMADGKKKVCNRDKNKELFH
ncbi:MAG: FAD-dependent oxidoreductase, partial [Cyanobacteria bacterium P01_D01_bin.2]